jgi:hypothetical protein
MLRVADCVRRCIRLAVPQTAKWQRIADSFAIGSFLSVT